MKKIILILILFIVLINNINAQTSPESTSLKGVVYGLNEKSKEALDGAVVKWINTKKGTLTDATGKFEISTEGITEKIIIVSYIGYKKDTIDVSGKDYVEVNMQSNFSTQQIVVQDQMKSTFIDNSLSKNEVTTQVELKKAACCDLSGVFEKSASVDVQVTDILTNTKELKVLGLEGAYTQILIDNLPMMSGIMTKFGVTSLPGTLINKITVSKGSNSVMQGYEAISGIMNVLLKDFGTSERFMLNGYMNDMLEKQFNLNTTIPVKNWTTLLALHTVQESRRMDENNDGFLDAPLTTRYMIYNKWKYGKSDDDNTNVTIGLKYLDEKRIGGQTNFEYDNDLGGNKVYGQTVKIQNGDFYTRISQKTGINKRLRIFAAGSFFNQDSYYGITKYDAKQKNFYLNSVYEFPIANKQYLNIGASYKYININEDIKFLKNTTKTYAGQYEKTESIPGIYSELTLDFENIGTHIIAGLRFDYHNKYNLVTTPRLMVKYDLTKLTTLRASFGTGFRTTNIFSEYANLLASGRNILFPEELKPEKMINYGLDLLQYYDFKSIAGNINFDFYRTNFSNKIIPNYEAHSLAVTFQNNDNAVSNVFQVESNMTILKNLEFKLAYKLIDQYYFVNGKKIEQPFNSKHRILSSLSYSPYDKNWNVNFSAQWLGKQTLPSTKDYPVEFQKSEESDSYMIINGQVSKFFKHFEIYAGVENLLNFRQENPIINPQNPFGQYFDTSYIWGPTTGRTYYLGFRLLFDKFSTN